MGTKRRQMTAGGSFVDGEAGALVRFVGDALDPDSHLLEGMFQLAFRVRREREIPHEHEAEFDELLNWLTANLDSPRRLSPYRRARRRGRAGAHRRTPIAISWFKSSATEHLERARRIASILRRCGFEVREIRTTRAGYVTHEDQHQVVAVPFRGESKGR